MLQTWATPLLNDNKSGGLRDCPGMTWLGPQKGAKRQMGRMACGGVGQTELSPGEARTLQRPSPRPCISILPSPAHGLVFVFKALKEIEEAYLTCCSMMPSTPTPGLKEKANPSL